MQEIHKLTTFAYIIFSLLAGTYSATAITKFLSNPIHMDNVGCYGTENRLIDCAYNTDTREDTHTGDVWIDCSGYKSTSKPDGGKGIGDGTGNGSDGSESNAESKENSRDEEDSDSGNSVALILSILALIGVLLIFIVLCYIIYMMWKKRSGVNQKMRWVQPCPFG